MAVAAYLVTVVDGDMARSLVVMGREAPWLLGLSAFLFGTATLLAALAWHAWLRALSETPALATSIYVWYASMLARYLPGGVLHIGSRLVMGQANGLGVRRVMISLFLEHGAMVGGAVLLALPLGLRVIPLPTLSVGVLVIALLIWLRWMDTSHPINRVLRWLGRKPVVYHMGLPTFLRIVSLYLLVIALNGLAVFVLVIPTVGPDGWLALSTLGIFSLSWLVGFLSPLPGGLGVREVTMGVLLTSALGVQPGDAMGIALTARLLGIVGELGGWLLVMVINASFLRPVRAGP